MAQNGTTIKPNYDMPPEIAEKLMNEHHMAWLSLSSRFRLQEDATPSFRQPDFSSWIQLD